MDETMPAAPDAMAPAANEAAPPDAALHGLVLLARFHGIAADPQQLAHELGCGAEPFDNATLLLAAKRLSLKARIGKQPAHRIGSANLPALAWSHHDDPPFLIARVLDGGSAVLIHDLQNKRAHRLTREQFEQRYAGRLMQVASRAPVLGELARFDFTWFAAGMGGIQTSSPAQDFAYRPPTGEDIRQIVQFYNDMRAWDGT